LGVDELTVDEITVIDLTWYHCTGVLQLDCKLELSQRQWWDILNVSLKMSPGLRVQARAHPNPTPARHVMFRASSSVASASSWLETKSDETRRIAKFFHEKKIWESQSASKNKVITLKLRSDAVIMTRYRLNGKMME